MRVTVLILYTTSWQPLADIVLPVAQKYCDKHGYSLVAKEYYEPYESDFGFNKLEEINNIFEWDEADYVWSLDLDTLITNHTIPVLDYCKDLNWIWITKDYNGINCGSFIARKCEWWINFYRWVMEQKGQPGIHCEQDAIKKYIETKDEDRWITVLPHPSINSYLYENYPEIPPQTKDAGQWEKGCFVLHLPGIGMDKRKELIQEHLKDIVYE